MVDFYLTIPQAIDALYEKRNSRLQLKREVDALESEEKALKIWIIEKLKEDGAEGMRGQTATASITRSREALAQDWPKIWNYIYETRDDGIIQRRLGITALRERWDNGVVIEGIEQYEAEDLSLTKAAAKKVK